MEMNDDVMKKIYEKMAQGFVQHGLPQDQTMPPTLAFAKFDGDKLMIADAPDISNLFDKRAGAIGKMIVGRIIEKLIDALPDDECLVFLSEAYMRSVKREEGQTLEEMRNQVPESLADDPLAEECLMINLYRKGAHMMGRLPINADRSVTFMPIEPMVHGEGRFCPPNAQPGPTDPLQ